MRRLSELTEEEGGTIRRDLDDWERKERERFGLNKNGGIADHFDQRTKRASTFAKRTCTFASRTKRRKEFRRPKSSRRQRTNLTSERSATLVQPNATSENERLAAVPAGARVGDGRERRTFAMTVTSNARTASALESNIAASISANRASLGAKARNAEREIVPDALRPNELNEERCASL